MLCKDGNYGGIAAGQLWTSGDITASGDIHAQNTNKCHQSSKRRAIQTVEQSTHHGKIEAVETVNA